jgi:hypothetical protein
MWDSIPYVAQALRFETVSPTMVKWEWLDRDGVKHTGEYPEAVLPRGDTVDLTAALIILQKGGGIQCVAGPLGRVNLGLEICVRGGKGLIRQFKSDWIPYGLSLQTLIDDLSRWPPNSRWVRVAGPP